MLGLNPASSLQVGERLWLSEPAAVAAEASHAQPSSRQSSEGLPGQLPLFSCAHRLPAHPAILQAAGLGAPLGLDPEAATTP